jgi:hypothetical protein
VVGHSHGKAWLSPQRPTTGSSDSFYIAALTPDAGETSQSQQEKFPVTDVFKYIELGEGSRWLQPEGVTCFAGTSWCSSKNLYGRPTMPRLPTSSTGVHLASSGSRSRVCTSWRRITGLCTRDGNDSWPSGWVQPHTKSKQPRSDVVPPRRPYRRYAFFGGCLIVFRMLSGTDRNILIS